jgi:hypothetical protein
VKSQRLEQGRCVSRQLVTRYEQLRCQGVKRSMSREMVILSKQGVCGWMQAWLSCAVDIARPCAGFEKAPSANVNQDKHVPFSDLKADIVNILATISLEKLKEERI